jgi:hypothetical protein
MPKPTVGTALDPSNALHASLLNGVALAVLESSGTTLADSANGDTATLPGAGAAIVPNSGDPYVSWTADSPGATLASNVTLPLASSYFFAWGGSLTTAGRMILGSNDGLTRLWNTPSDTLALQIGGAGALTFAGITGLAADHDWAVAAVWDGTAFHGTLFKDGVSVATDNEPSTGTTGVINLVGNGYPSDGFGYLGTLRYFYIGVGHDFTSGDAAALHANPYSVFSVSGGGDTTPPVVSSASVDPSGTQFQIFFNEAGSSPVLPATGATGFNPNFSGGAATLSSPTIAGTTYSATISRTILAGETATLDYVPGNVTDSASPPNALAGFFGSPVTNTSTQTGVTGSPVHYVTNGTGGGNWNSGSTWNPVGVPSATDGDTAAFLAGDTVTVPLGVSSSLGSGTASVMLDLTHGALVVNGSLTVRGSVRYGTSQADVTVTRPITLGPGASLIIDGNSGVAPVLTGVRDAVFTANGTSGSPCTVDGKGGAGLPARFAPEVGGSSGYVDLPLAATHTTFRNLGDATNPCFNINLNSNVSGGVASLDFVTFDNSGTFKLVVGHGDVVASVTNTRFINPLSTPFQFFGSGPVTGGTRLLRYCVVSGDSSLSLPPSFASQQDWSILNNYFDQYVIESYGLARHARFEGNFVRKSAPNETTLAGDIIKNYFYNDPSGTSADGFFLGSTRSYSVTGNVFELHAGAAGDADYGCASTDTVDEARTITVTGNLILANAFGGASGPLINGPTSTPQPFDTTFIIENNTGFIGPQGLVFLTSASGGPERTGVVSSLRGNLGVRTGTALHNLLVNAAVLGPLPVTDSAPASALDHNAYCGLARVASGTWSATAGANDALSTGTVYDTPMSGTLAPGVGDVDLGTAVDLAALASGGPEFVDPTRNLAAWDASLGGPGTGASALARLRTDPSLTESALIPWVFAGFAPRNAALLGTGPGGTDMGAVQRAGFTFAPPAPAKGDVTTASGNFTVTPAATYTGTVTITPGGGGLSTPIVLTWSGTADPQTFAITPTRWGVVTLTPTNSGGLPNPAPVTYLSMVQVGKSGTAPGGNVTPSFGGFPLLANGYYAELARDISGDPVDPQSAAMMANDFPPGTNLSHPLCQETAAGGNSLYGMPFNVVPGTQAERVVNSIFYAGESDTGPVPIPSDASIENWHDPGSAPPASDPTDDKHCLTAVRNETTGGIDLLVEAYGIWSADGGTTWNLRGLAKFDIAAGTPRREEFTSVDAAGLPMLPLLTTWEQAESGDIGHAIRAAFAGAYQFTHPARHAANFGSGALVPYGGRIRLTLSWYDNNKDNYTGHVRAFIDAFRKYGIMNADNSGLGYSPSITATVDHRWNFNALPDAGSLLNLDAIPMTAFEVVEVHPGWTVTGPASGAAGDPVTLTATKYPPGDSNFDYVVYFWNDEAHTDNTGFLPTAVEIKDGQPSMPVIWTPAGAGPHLVYTTVSSYMVPAPPFAYTATGGGGPAPLAAGVVAFVESGPAGIRWTASPATGGTAPLANRWQRNAGGGAFADLADTGGVTGSATLDLFDGSAVEGTLYGYRLVTTDAASASATSNTLTAKLYPGGDFGTGGTVVDVNLVSIDGKAVFAPGSVTFPGSVGTSTYAGGAVAGVTNPVVASSVTSPVVAASVIDRTGFKLAADGVEQVMVTTTLNLRRVLNAVLGLVGAGKLRGVPAPGTPGQIIVRDPDDTVDAATVGVDGDGNRTSASLAPPA